MSGNLPPLITPFRFTTVEDKLYRGAYPTLKNMRFMRRLHLRTIISLLPQSAPPSADLSEFCASENIRLYHHYAEKYDNEVAVAPAVVAAIISLLIDPENHPAFIHCRDGGHNTGLVIMCLRRLQNWNLAMIYDEFVRYTKSGVILVEEKQFVESFAAPIAVPLTIPHWLWQGIRIRSHPSVNLELRRSLGEELDRNSSNWLNSFGGSGELKSLSWAETIRKDLCRPTSDVERHFGEKFRLGSQSSLLKVQQRIRIGARALERFSKDNVPYYSLPLAALAIEGLELRPCHPWMHAS